MVIPIMIAAIISVYIGIFPGFMMKFVDRVTPDDVVVAMPQYKPEGAPPFVPKVKSHGEADTHGEPDEDHGAPAENHGQPVDKHKAPSDH
jgi:hypothetical protein